MIARNNTVISNAFASLTARKDQIIQEGFIRMMEAGLEYLLEAHDEFRRKGHNIHWHNLDERETAGWMIFHDGVEVASGAQDRGPLEGSVRDILLNLEGRPQNGWVGYLMSEMTFDHYRVDYEIAWLLISSDNIKGNFSSFFRPIR